MFSIVHGFKLLKFLKSSLLFKDSAQKHCGWVIIIFPINFKYIIEISKETIEGEDEIQAQQKNELFTFL